MDAIVELIFILKDFVDETDLVDWKKETFRNRLNNLLEEMNW